MDGLKGFVKENLHLRRDYGSDFGWGNGYAIVPVGHKFHGKDYDEINNEISIHGGLTFSDYAKNLPKWDELKNVDPESWVIGFDTCHFGDTLDGWPKEAVQSEVVKLCSQVSDMC